MTVRSIWSADWRDLEAEVGNVGMSQTMKDFVEKHEDLENDSEPRWLLHGAHEVAMLMKSYAHEVAMRMK